MSAPERTPSPPLVGARPGPDGEGAPGGGYLVLVGVTADGRRLRLADPHDPSGPEFTVEIDARLRAALGVQPSTRPEKPVPKVETQMDSTLRPRDIQARIRAGETPESVAAAAETTVEKVMPYAAPVLAEREHVAERPSGPPSAAPPERARTAPAPSARRSPATCTGGTSTRRWSTWDSWRREDGRWTLTGRFSVQSRDGIAEFTSTRPATSWSPTTTTPAGWSASRADPRPQPEPEARRRAGWPPYPPRTSCQLTRAIDCSAGDLDRRADRGLPRRPRPGLDETELAEEAADAMAARRRRRGRARAGARSAARSRRRAAAPRCRAGTRSCSAAASE